MNKIKQTIDDIKLNEQDKRKIFNNIVIPAFGVGYQAVTAVLDPIFHIAEISSAAVPQRIQRTVTKQAAEVLRVSPCMAGEILTFPVLEIRIMLAVPFFHIKGLL